MYNSFLTLALAWDGCLKLKPRPRHCLDSTIYESIKNQYVLVTISLVISLNRVKFLSHAKALNFSFRSNVCQALGSLGVSTPLLDLLEGLSPKLPTMKTRKVAKAKQMPFELSAIHLLQLGSFTDRPIECQPNVVGSET